MQESLDLTKLRKAQDTFERFRRQLQTEQEKAGAVQAFEFCYELAWKMLRRVITQRGVEVGSPKETFRKAALDGLIDDPEIWFQFQKLRNLTVHTYNQECLEEIVANFESFSKELRALLATLETSL